MKTFAIFIAFGTGIAMVVIIVVGWYHYHKGYDTIPNEINNDDNGDNNKTL